MMWKPKAVKKLAQLVKPYFVTKDQDCSHPVLIQIKIFGTVFIVIIFYIHKPDGIPATYWHSCQNPQECPPHTYHHAPKDIYQPL